MADLHRAELALDDAERVPDLRAYHRGVAIDPFSGGVQRTALRDFVHVTPDLAATAESW